MKLSYSKAKQTKIYMDNENVEIKCQHAISKVKKIRGPQLQVSAYLQLDFKIAIHYSNVYLYLYNVRALQILQSEANSQFNAVN